MRAPDRYARHTVLPEIGPEGQARLAAARVLCVGAGGLASAALPYLVGAGVGRITIVDPDRVDRTNLQRQVLFGEGDVGAPKVRAAAARLRGLNGDVEIVALEDRVDASNVEVLLSAHDLVLDGSDSYATKYLLADTAVRLERPLVYGSVNGWEAMVTVFDVRDGPCLRCLFPEPPRARVPNCNEAGVFGPLVGVTGAMQAGEALKVLLGDPSLRPLVGRLWFVDGRDLSTRQLRVARRPGCAGCAGTATPVPDDAVRCATQVAGDWATAAAIDARAAAALAGALFVDVRESDEFETGHLPGAVNRPLSALRAAPPSLPDAPAYVLYCSRGVRSRAAAEILIAAGVLGVHHLEGGLASWAGPHPSCLPFGAARPHAT